MATVSVFIGDQQDDEFMPVAAVPLLDDWSHLLPEGDAILELAPPPPHPPLSPPMTATPQQSALAIASELRLIKDETALRGTAVLSQLAAAESPLPFAPTIVSSPTASKPAETKSTPGDSSPTAAARESSPCPTSTNPSPPSMTASPRIDPWADAEFWTDDVAPWPSSWQASPTSAPSCAPMEDVWSYWLSSGCGAASLTNRPSPTPSSTPFDAKGFPGCWPHSSAPPRAQSPAPTGICQQAGDESSLGSIGDLRVIAAHDFSMKLVRCGYSACGGRASMCVRTRNRWMNVCTDCRAWACPASAVASEDQMLLWLSITPSAVAAWHAMPSA